MYILEMYAGKCGLRLYSYIIKTFSVILIIKQRFTWCPTLVLAPSAVLITFFANSCSENKRLRLNYALLINTSTFGFGAELEPCS